VALQPGAAQADGQLTQPKPESVPARLAAVPSTVIRSFDYLPESEQLLVEFVTGRRYAYSGVPAEEAEAMRRAFAKGTFFNRRIRDRYPYREVV
jgi:hypothetical protein